MDKNTKWPSINISKEDKGLMDAICSQKGYLQNMDRKDLMLVAAALAIKNSLPPEENGKLEHNITHSSLLNGSAYSEYRQYIAVIYFLTAANKNIDNMGTPQEMCKNLVDYQHRGLKYLKATYLDNRDASEDLMMDFTELLGNIKKDKTPELSSESILE